MKDDSRPLRSVLDALLQGSPLQEGIQRQSAIELWPEIVGPEIARHSRAVSLDRGVLRVVVEGSVWANELQLLSPKILTAFRAQIGDDAIERIRFDSGSWNRRAHGDRRV